MAETRYRDSQTNKKIRRQQTVTVERIYTNVTNVDDLDDDDDDDDDEDDQEDGEHGK